jgi:predicted SnoaL-like aldol condensation-catalyzing enzyme
VGHLDSVSAQKLRYKLVHFGVRKLVMISKAAKTLSEEEAYMSSNASPCTSTEDKHSLVHSTVSLFAFQPSLRSEFVRVMAEDALVKLGDHRIHTDLVQVSKKFSRDEIFIRTLEPTGMW